MADITSPVSGPHSAHHDSNDTHTGSPFAVRATAAVLAIIVLVLAYVSFHEKAMLGEARNQLNQANSERDQARSDADTSKTQIGTLQTQLASSNEKNTDLQRQLLSAQTQGTDFRSQLNKAQAAQNDLRSQLDAAKTQSSAVQSELSRANDGAADLRKQLDQANARSVDLQAQLDKAKAQSANPQPAAAAALRAMPIAATFEKGFWGGKYTMHVKNQGSDPLPVNVTVDGGAVKSTVVQPGATYDVGDLKSDSKIVISSDGFETANLAVK
jgi:septal ring factor EnvC (AmiA/AmiB activator)